ncbi:hypothetical protein [Enterococcus sp. DIV1420a]|uniref:hypothetical protein n=1 Tax=Enterococcus sp. DIV1420a TaxID=2774672 RepID=UPI003F22C58D
MNLEELTRQLERLEQEKGLKLREYTQRIQELQWLRTKVEQEYQQKISTIQDRMIEQMADDEKVETESFVLTKKQPNLSRPANYKLQLPKDKEEREPFINYLRQEHPGLIKATTEYKPIQNDFKKLIADGVFHLTADNQVIDDNGCLIPYLKVNVKGVEVKVKVKKG